MVYAIVGVLLLLADQLLKYYTVTHVALNIGIQNVVPGVFHLTNIKNFGALFGVLQNASWLRWVLLLLLLVFTAAMVFAYIRGFFRTGFSRWTGALLLAGLLGNGIDRAIYGYVVDMIELELFDFAIFNLADILVIVFGILFCVSLLTGGLRFSEEDEYEEEEYEQPVRRAVPARAPAPAAERVPVRTASTPARRSEPRRFEDEMPVRPRRTAESAPSEIRARAAVAEAEDTVRTVRRPAPHTAASTEKAAASATTRPVAPAARPTAPTAAPTRPTAPAAKSAPAARPTAPAAKPAPAARPAAPAVKSAPAPKPAAPSADEFDLESILAEFK